MRIEVPEKVFDGLESCRRQHGSMGLLSWQTVHNHFTAYGFGPAEIEWIDTHHSTLITTGAVVGFKREGEPVLPEPARGSDEPGDEYG